MTVWPSSSSPSDRCTSDRSRLGADCHDQNRHFIASDSLAGYPNRQGLVTGPIQTFGINLDVPGRIAPQPAPTVTGHGRCAKSAVQRWKIVKICAGHACRRIRLRRKVAGTYRPGGNRQHA